MHQINPSAFTDFGFEPLSVNVTDFRLGPLSVIVTDFGPPEAGKSWAVFGKVFSVRLTSGLGFSTISKDFLPLSVA